MTTESAVDRHIASWLAEAAGTGRIDYLAETLERTAATKQRPAWTIPGRWLPMQLSMARVAAPRAAYLALAALLVLLALLAAAVFVGSRSPKLPPPLGPAANGLIADEVGYRLFVMDATGAGRHAITREDETASDPVWSADGTRMAFYSWPTRTGVDASVGGGPPIYDSPEKPLGSLVVTDAEGGHRTVLATALTFFNGTTVMPPAWSHDGRHIALTVKPGDTPEVEVVSVAGGAATTFERAEAPTWSPDDTRIAFGRPGVGVYVAPFGAPDQVRQVSTQAGSNFSFVLPQWSPDGTKVAYYAGEDVHGIYVIDLPTGAERSVAADLDGDKYWPVWSPDGSKLAFKRAIDSANDAHWVVAESGLTVWRELSTLPVDPFLGSWSPDGRYLIAHVGNAAGTAIDHLLLVDVADPSRSFAIASAADLTDWQRVAP